GFAEASHLGSDTLAAILDEMLTDGSNAAVYHRLRDFLFTVALTGEDRGHREDHEASGDHEASEAGEASEDHEARDACDLGDDRDPEDVRDLGSTGDTSGRDDPGSRGSGHAPAHQASAPATADRTTTADDTATASAPTTTDATAAADETAAADALRSALTDRRAAWVRKPLSYLMDLHAGTVIVNVEHTVVDGGSLVDAVTRMQEHAAAQVPEASTPASPGTPPPNLQASPNAATDPNAATAPDLPANPDARAVAEIPARSNTPAELRWNLTAGLQAALTAALTDLGQRAEDLRVAVVRVPRPAADEQARPYSSDALQQLIMASAQVLTYGRVRGVYESVDMRAFQDGRTECLRPVTPEAVTFARRLCDSQARLEDLEAALDAHRAWVKACKSGNGFDRHLAGLRMMAARQGGTVDPFLTSFALARMRTDFLSTTSLGTPAQVVRYAFAPTVEDGFGIAYTQRAQDYEFCVSWHAGSAEAPDAFLTNIPRAAALLRDFLRTLCTDG
uniref:choline/carnitine O-acyltransferase n=1 Tax=Brevibacterium sp. TaxID=1701 RepID=UPI0025BBF9EA